MNFVNTSSAACYLDGFPGVSYVDGSGIQIGVPASEGGGMISGFDYGPVPLVPGGSAVAVLQLVDVGFYPAAECQPVTPAGIRVYPPGSFTSTIVAFSVQVCSNLAFTGWSYVSDVISSTLSPF